MDRDEGIVQTVAVPLPASGRAPFPGLDYWLAQGGTV
jgi:hypothetical protein